MIVTAHHLGKRFNREWVFRNFDFQFKAGEKYAITGPNGSGKSTLMQVLWGQMHPSEGSIQYSVQDHTNIYKSVAIATPYLDLIDEFTLEEMVRFHFHFKKSGVAVNEVLDKIELDSSRKKVISSFSSGMRQRVKLALAFYAEADLLFLDEPCTNLDKKSIDWYATHLAQVPASTTVFIASNQEHEYPASAVKIDILVYKNGYFIKK